MISTSTLRLSAVIKKWWALGLQVQLVLLLLAICQARAQAPAWQTAIAPNQASGNNLSLVRATATNASGDVYVTGNFQGTVSFGNTTLTGAGANTFDVFVAKWSPNTGNFVWAQRAGSADTEQSLAIAANGTNVYIAGYFNGATATFGSTTLTSRGTGDAFVAKITDAGSSGSFTWAQGAGGAAGDAAIGVTVSGAGVYVVGDMNSATASFGGITLTNADNSASTADVFVAKLVDAGPSASFAWAQRAGGVGSDLGNAVAVNGPNVYVAGSFASPTAAFGATTLANVTTPGGTNGYDAFVAKLADAGSTGDFVWARQAGGSAIDVANAVAVSGANVYVGGSFTSATTSFGSTLLANNGAGYDAYVAALVDAGSSANFSWAQRAGGSGNDFVNAVAATSTNVYVAGSFSSPTATFGSSQPGGTSLVNANSNNTADVFVAKLTNAGPSTGFTWAQRAGGMNNDYGQAVALSGTSVHVAGYLAPPASFGSLSITAPAGGQVGFVASLLDATGLAAATPRPLAGLVLAPNPAHGTVTVQLPAIPGAAQATLTLLDALGRTVRKQLVPPRATGATAEMPLAGLAPGLYHLRVQAGEQQASRTLAVE